MLTLHRESSFSMDEKLIAKIKSAHSIVGRYEGLDHALNVALQVAPTDLPVLVTGENGTGKEMIPRIIHENSLRKNKNYFAINCGSIPEGTIDSELFGHVAGAFTGAIGDHKGYFGVANGGTLFLDEVGELPLNTQARLLRVLETGEFISVGSSQVQKTDVRIVAATNVNLPKAISEGRFREDLYYRLNTIFVQVPPLRERGEDIILLFNKFALDTSEKYRMPCIRLSEDGKQHLLKYSWPGNVRQLKNVAENLSITSGERIITAQILENYIPLDRQSTELVQVNGEGQHSYTREREMLFNVLLELRNEVKDLKGLVASQEKRLNELGGHVTVPTHHVSALPSSYSEHNDIYVEEAEPILQMSDLEKDAIKKSLDKYHGSRRNAAAELGISERTLYRKIKNYGLEKDE